MKNYTTIAASAALAVAGFGIVDNASADTIDFDLTGISSVDAFGSALNTVLSFNIGANCERHRHRLGRRLHRHGQRSAAS